MRAIARAVAISGHVGRSDSPLARDNFYISPRRHISQFLYTYVAHSGRLFLVEFVEDNSTVLGVGPEHAGAQSRAPCIEVGHLA